MKALLLIALFLAACGGGDEPKPAEVASCQLPADQSAFSMACATSAYVGPTYSVTVEITGKVSSRGTFQRYVSIGIGGDGYQGRYLSQSGEFRIVQTVTSESLGAPKWVDIGLSSMDILPESSKLEAVSIKVTAAQR